MNIGCRAPTDSAASPTNIHLASTALCSVVIAAPMFIARFPPMVDLPQHAAQVSAFLDILAGRADLAQLYRLNWFTPYLLGYMLVAALTPLLGVLLACKVVVAAAMAAMPWAVRYLTAPARLDDRWLWLLPPTMYGFAFHWGFLNFVIAAPVGLVMLGAAWRHNDHPTRRSSMLMAVAMPALFLCHALTSLLVGGLAGLDALLRKQRPGEVLRRIAPLFSVVPVMLAWGLLTRSTEAQVHWPILWDQGWHRVTQLPILVFGAPGLLNYFGVALVALPFALGLLRPSREIRRWVPLLVTGAVLLFVPHVIFGNAFTYQRFGIFVVPFVLFAAEPGTTNQLRRYWSLAFTAVASLLWMGLVALFMRGFDKEAEGFDRLLAKMAPDKQVLQLIAARDSNFAPTPVYLHFGAWYQALRHGPVDFSFANFPFNLVRYRPETARPAAQGFEWAPGSFDWHKHAGSNYDYFIVRAPVDASAILFRTAPAAPTLLFHENEWWLYGRPPNACCGEPGPADGEVRYRDTSTMEKRPE